MYKHYSAQINSGYQSTSRGQGMALHDKVQNVEEGISETSTLPEELKGKEKGVIEDKFRHVLSLCCTWYRMAIALLHKTWEVVWRASGEAELLKACEDTWWMWWTMLGGGCSQICAMRYQSSPSVMIMEEYGWNVWEVGYVVWNFFRSLSGYVEEGNFIQEGQHYTKTPQRMFGSIVLGLKMRGRTASH